MNAISCVRRITLCGLVLVLSCAGPANAQKPAELKVPVLLMKDEVSANHISRDGRYLLYTDWTVNELFVRDLSTGSSRQLTFKPAGRPGEGKGAYDALISPDGSRVAYNWSLGQDPWVELRVCAFSGGEPRRLDASESGVAVFVKGWSADSKELLVVKGTLPLEKPGDLGMFAVETRAFRRIGAALITADARLSPDGSRVVLSQLSKEHPTHKEIRLIDSTTGESRLLLSGSADAYSPDWTPDGRGVLFISDRGGRPQLWELNLKDGAKPKPLADLVDGALHISGVTRSGQVVVDAAFNGVTDSYSGTVDWASGRVVNVELLKNPPFKSSRRPVPSPDGRLVAFIRKGRDFGVRPGWQIPVVHSFDTGRDRVYPTALTLRDAPVWSADQQSLVFAMPPEGAIGESTAGWWSFVRLDLKTGKYVEVGKTDSIGGVRLAGMSAQSLYYLLGGKRVMALDWKTGTNRQILQWTGQGQMTDAAVVGETERVAFGVYEGSTRRLATIFVAEAEKEAVRVTQLQANSRAQLVWASDRKSILASGALAGKEGIWRIPVNGGEPQRLDLDQPGVIDVRLSENGQRIGFTQQAAKPNEIRAYSLSAQRSR